MSNTKIVSIRPGAIVTLQDDYQRRLYIVKSIIKSNYERYVLFNLLDKSIRNVAANDVRLIAIECMNTFINPHGEEVDLDEFIHRKKSY